ncbi:MAG: hypothetical protein FK731_02035 [Asgard group archaeon]|nr:hypothetical protein [Asgard group archaeon]
MKLKGFNKTLLIILIFLMPIQDLNQSTNLNVISSIEKDSSKYNQQIIGDIIDFCIQDDLLIISIENEIRIYDNSDPEGIKLLSVIKRVNKMHVEVHENLLVTADKYTSEILVINISNPKEPEILSSHQSELDYDPIYCMLVLNTTIFVCDTGYIDVYDFSNPYNLEKISTYRSIRRDMGYKLYAYDKLLFKFGNEHGVEIININQLTKLEFVAVIDKTVYAQRTIGVIMKGNYLITIPYTDVTIKVYNMENQSNPELVARGDFINHFLSRANWEDRLFIAGFSNVYVMDISNPLGIETKYIIPNTLRIDSFVADDLFLYCVSNFFSYGVITLEYMIPFTPPPIITNPPTTYPTAYTKTQKTNTLKAPAIIISIVMPILFVVTILKLLRIKKIKE